MTGFTDKDSGTAAQGPVPHTAGQLQDPRRRSFSRNALAGSAVLLSLGNRSAWGQTLGCMSVATINSFDPATGMFISTPAGRPDHNPDLAAEFHRVSTAAEDYLGTGIGSDGMTYSSCYDPNDPGSDTRCLVKGDTCP